MRAVSLLVEVTSTARNAIFGSAGTADMFCRQFQKIIHQSVRCVIQNLTFPNKIENSV